MLQGWLLTVLGLFVVACSAAPAVTPQPTPLPKPTAVPATVVPTAEAPKPTAGTNYVQLRGELLVPLGALIVTLRAKSGREAMHLAAFNEVAARVEPAIAGDMSINANRLHSSIVNTRDAAARKDLEELERIRLNLLDVR